MVKAGTRNNIIPDKSQITGTIRTFDPDLRAEIYDEIRQIARGVEAGTGAEVEVEFDVGGFYPVTYNNIELTNQYAQTLSEAADGKFFQQYTNNRSRGFFFLLPEDSWNVFGWVLMSLE